MATLYTHKDRNLRLTWVYLIGFLVFVIFIGWFFALVMDNSVILYGAVIFAVAMNFVSYWWSDKIILKIAGAQEIGKKTPNEREIYRLVENLCITAGLPVPKIYLIPDTALNAFATGRDPAHAVIALTVGIVEKLDKRELEGVIAHELSHIGNRDILLGAVITILVGFIALLADLFVRWTWFGGSKKDGEGNNQMQLILTIVAIVLAILAPIGATLMQLAISRNREFLADADAALLTRYPEGLASALEKISAHPAELATANKATAHMYIASPFRGKNAKKTTSFFATHPATEERIRRLRGTELA